MVRLSDGRKVERGMLVSLVPGARTAGLIAAHGVSGWEVTEIDDDDGDGDVTVSIRMPGVAYSGGVLSPWHLEGVQ